MAGTSVYTVGEITLLTATFLATSDANRSGMHVNNAPVWIATGLFVLTGGDPMRRPDLKELVGHAVVRGLRVALSPSATPEFANADLALWRQRGVRRRVPHRHRAARSRRGEL